MTQLKPEQNAALAVASPAPDEHPVARAASAHAVLEPAIARLAAAVRTDRARVLGAPDDPEAVHDFRVGLRRLRTLLRCARPLYGETWTRRRLGEIARQARATSRLRDEEVLAETVRVVRVGSVTRGALALWLAGRRAHQRSLRRAVIAELGRRELDACLWRLGRRIARGPRRDWPAELFAAASLGHAYLIVAGRLSVGPDDGEGLHRLRIAFKRLRYTAELLEAVGLGSAAGGVPALGASCAEVAEHAREMQGALGHLHDLALAAGAVRRARRLSRAEREQIAGALDRRRQRLARAAVRRLRQLGQSTPPPAAAVETPAARDRGESRLL
ncbi:MAG: CHAD domain-containing protein [Deltaproteobacteria bacterium]|nr:CHAD domain-containing protein [Deltaproteobacteria bacterium]